MRDPQLLGKQQQERECDMRKDAMACHGKSAEDCDDEPLYDVDLMPSDQ